MLISLNFHVEEELDKIFEKQRTLMSELSELDANLQKKQKDLEVETNSIMKVCFKYRKILFIGNKTYLQR